MADILIKGMEMPREGNVYLIVGEDGMVSKKIGSMYHVTTEAIELPPHGSLKDESDILRIFDKYLPKVDDDTNALLCEVLAEIHLQAPTVLEATNGTDN